MRMTLCCFRAWTTCLIKGKVNSHVYEDIVHNNIRVAVWQLKLSRSWMTQQDNDPKYQIKSLTVWLQKKKRKENSPFGEARSEARS